MVARALNVATVVSGSVRRAESRLRMTVELVDAATGYQRWSGRYERELRDVFALQDEVSRAVVAALAPQLLGELRPPPAPARTGNLEAYDLYLRGRHFLGQLSREGDEKAIAHFEHALAQDPGYALAWAGIADAYTLLGYGGHLRPHEAMPRAADAVQRALALDATLAEAHASLGMIHLVYDWDWEGAARELRTAIALKPNYATAHQWYANYLLATGAVADAVEEMGQARALDPLSQAINTAMGPMLVLARRYDEGIEQLRRTVDLDPGFANAYGFLSWAYHLAGRRAEAVVAMEQAMALVGQNPLGLAYLKALAGEQAGARRLMAWVEQAAASLYVQPVFVARVYALLGDAPAALAWLERAYTERDGWVIYMGIDPTFEPFRAEPSFLRLLARLRLPRSGGTGLDLEAAGRHDPAADSAAPRSLGQR